MWWKRSMMAGVYIQLRKKEGKGAKCCDLYTQESISCYGQMLEAVSGGEHSVFSVLQAFFPFTLGLKVSTVAY